MPFVGILAPPMTGFGRGREAPVDPLLRGQRRLCGNRNAYS